MDRDKLLKLVYSALFAALICAATMVIRIPSPMNGYVNFGDCFVLLSAWALGPVYGFAASGIGSALADLFSGYAHYIPATFIIKGMMAVAAALIAKAVIKRRPRLRLIGYSAGALVGEAIMVSGYFGYAALLLGRGFGALASVPGNAVQGAVGIVGSIALVQALSSVKLLKNVK